MSLTGILLDVSASMRQNIGSGTAEEGGPWARSMFQVIDDFIKCDCSPDDRVFAFGFGAKRSPEIFDIISAVQDKQNAPTEKSVEKILKILETNGAGNIRNWVKVGSIEEVVSDKMALIILTHLEFDKQFVRRFVHEFLPWVCRDTTSEPANADMANPHSLVTGRADVVKGNVSRGVGRRLLASKKDIIKVVYKATSYVQNQSIFSVQHASRIIRGFVGEKELSVERSKELLENVEPFIYGETPLYQALDKARCLLLENNAKHKLLFVLSDGVPTDGHNGKSRSTLKALSEMKDSGVKVVSCFITRSTAIQPKRLYNKLPAYWERGAKIMFSLSSVIPTEFLPRAILVKRGWTVDVTNNETKLFVQVNHPDNLKEACDMSRSVVYCQDTLADLLVSVNLDIYINQTRGGFTAREQDGGTCYANASAAVLHLAMKRILGRERGYPDFQALRDEMIQAYGCHGANTSQVLQAICPKYRLHCRKINSKEAMEAIVKKRPVVTTFRATDQEWEVFGDFYKNNPTGILTADEINLRRRLRGAHISGHAVVLMSYNSKCLILMNSWGHKWADKGFFRVENSDVLQLEFFDVYWTLNDLTDYEKTYYKKHGPEDARKLIESLKGLQKAEYKCPKCNAVSLITKFTGTLSEVECPECSEKFSAFDNESNILALSLYLTTLAR